MVSEDHLATLRRGIPSWNEWRTVHSVTPDLSGADLRATDFTSANLEGTNFTRAQLAGATFAEARVGGATFREADLSHADLRGAIGVTEDKFAGANLAGARLPDTVSLVQRLGRVEDIFSNCQQIFLTLFVAALYTWLTIAATTHARLLGDSASSPLPIVGTPIPIAQFYLVAPIVVLILFGYLHLSLQRLWNYLAGLPAIFPDGERLDQKSYPRVLSSFIRTQCGLLRPGCPFDLRLLTWALSLFVWGGGAFLVAWVWWQYLPRREWLGASLLFALLLVSVVLGVTAYRVATCTLRGTSTEVYREGLVVLAVSTVLLGGVFIVKVNGQQPDDLAQRCVEPSRGVAGLWTMVRDSLRCSPLANLRQADVSVKPPSWRGSDDEAGAVQGALLRGKNLSYARAAEAFLVKADLSDATLVYANLEQAQLQRAILRGADLSGAWLLWASLQGADLRGAKLAGTILRSANLTGAKLSRFNNCNQRCFLATRLTAAILANADLNGADLKEANLDDAQLEGASLVNTDLSGASLVRANLRGANLVGVQMSAVGVAWLDHCVDAQNSCSRALDSSRVAPADLSGANLLDADFSGASLSGVNFQNADLRSANFQDADLSGATGLTIDQLATAASLYKATLDQGLRDQISKRFPHLLKLSQPKPSG
jgi:uncharacterized protein YjbI with pentapeptide repeats